MEQPSQSKMSGKPHYSQPPPYCTYSEATISLPPPVSYPCRKRICNCSSKTWATVIAGLQIFLAVIAIIQAFKTAGAGGRGRYEYYYNSHPNYRVVNGFANLALGFILLAGIHYKKHALVVIWLVLCGFGIVGVTILLIIIFLVILFAGGEAFAAFLVLLFGLLLIAIPAFCFHAVNLYMHDMAEEEIRNQTSQTAQFRSVQVQ